MQKDMLVINVTPISQQALGLSLLLNFHELVKVANLTDDFMQIIENECISITCILNKSVTGN